MSRRDMLKNQYDMVKQTIISNTNSIKQLIAQAQDLTKFAESLGEGDDSANAELKVALEKQIDNIINSISSIVDNTKTLFESYERFSETVFRGE